MPYRKLRMNHWTSLWNWCKCHTRTEHCQRDSTFRQTDACRLEYVDSSTDSFPCTLSGNDYWVFTCAWIQPLVFHQKLVWSLFPVNWFLSRLTFFVSNSCFINSSLIKRTSVNIRSITFSTILNWQIRIEKFKISFKILSHWILRQVLNLAKMTLPVF